MTDCPNCEYYRKRAQLWRDEAYKQAGHPLPEREWVGLTDEEIYQGLVRTNYAMQTAGAWRDGVEWATKQLREKNNG